MPHSSSVLVALLHVVSDYQRLDDEEYDAEEAHPRHVLIGQSLQVECEAAALGVVQHHVPDQNRKNPVRKGRGAIAHARVSLLCTHSYA